MIRKELQEKYNIFGENKDISLYRKRGEFACGYGYCGNIQLKNGKAIFNGQSYSNIESLDNAFREWEKTLPWPVDTYNPMVRKGFLLETRIVWYLTEKMGFTESSANWQITYVKNIGSNCKVSFEIERNKNLEDEDVTITSTYGKYTFRQKVTNADDAVATISSLIKHEILAMSSGMVDILSKCPDVEVPNIEAYTKSNTSIFGFERVDFKSVMIELLENELKKLKSKDILKL